MQLFRFIFLSKSIGYLVYPVLFFNTVYNKYSVNNFSKQENNDCYIKQCKYFFLILWVYFENSWSRFDENSEIFLYKR